MGWERILAGAATSWAEAGQLQATRREKMRDDMAMEQWRRGLEDESKRRKEDALAVLIQAHRSGVNLMDPKTHTPEVRAAIAGSGVSQAGLLKIVDDEEDRAHQQQQRAEQRRSWQDKRDDEANQQAVAEVVEIALEQGRTKYGLIDRREVDIEAIVDEVVGAGVIKPEVRKEILLEAQKQFRISVDHENRAVGAEAEATRALKTTRALYGDDGDDSSTNATPTEPETVLPKDVKQKLVEGVDLVADAIMKEQNMSIDAWFDTLITSDKQIDLRQKLTDPIVGLWKQRMREAGHKKPTWNTDAQEVFLEDVKRELLIRIGGDTRLQTLLGDPDTQGYLAAAVDSKVYSALSGYVKSSIRAALDNIAKPAETPTEQDDEVVKQDQNTLTEEDIAELGG